VPTAYIFHVQCIIRDLDQGVDKTVFMTLEHLYYNYIYVFNIWYITSVLPIFTTVDSSMLLLWVESNDPAKRSFYYGLMMDVKNSIMDPSNPKYYDFNLTMKNQSPVFDIMFEKVIKDSYYLYVLPTEVCISIMRTLFPLVYILVNIYFVFMIIYFTCLFIYLPLLYLKGEAWVSDKVKGVIGLYSECEKEIAGFDDIYTPIVFLTFVYSWFFVITPVAIYFFGPEFYIVTAVFPFILLSIFLMPVSIIFDYGAVFSSYLRGAGATVLFALEFMYDCLATLIMFVRLGVQNIRFLLMFFAFVELYEILSTVSCLKSDILQSEETNSTLRTIGNTINSVFYILFSVVPFIVFKYIYQVTHLLFTVTSHFFAYLALVFWLFSFLYTSFFSNKCEQYFYSLRADRQNKIKIDNNLEVK
jgi:hypothetical protein